MTTEHSINPLSSSSVQSPRAQRKRLLERWPLWGFTSLVIAVLMGGGAAFTLITQPPKPNCSFVLWPFAPASLRLYCAQELAEQPTLENLIDAIALVDALGENHPLRGAINPRIESWSKLLLDRAEETFNAGELERAIEFAEKVPIKTKAAKLVEERTSRWRRIWAEGEAIDARVAFALREEDWRKAFGLMVDFLYVDNRYWSQTQYQQITDVIFQAQKDEKKVIESEVRLKAGGFENLEKAISLTRELSANTIFKLSRKKIFNGVAEKFVKIAEQALEREDLTEAIDALSYIPRESRLWEYSQDLSKIANATSLTWGVSSNGYQRAIEELAEIPKSSKLYGKAQALILRWKAQIASVKQLEEAQLKALSGSRQDLLDAIAMAQQVPQDNDKWGEARDNIRDWSNQIERSEDQPILDLADELSLPGDENALRNAIAQAQKIGPSRLMYDEAQSRIRYWRSRIKDLSEFQISATPIEEPTIFESPSLPPDDFNDFDAFDTSSEPIEPETPLPVEESLVVQAQQLANEGTPEALQSAMDTANKVPLASTDRTDADIVIENWGNQLLSQAEAQAEIDPQQAIAIAQRIPSYSQQYQQAQILIERLSATEPIESTD